MFDLLSKAFDTVVNTVTGAVTSNLSPEQKNAGREFQLENRASVVVRDHLIANDIEYEGDVKSTVRAMVKLGILRDQASRHQLVARCAHYFRETKVMKRQTALIDRRRRDINTLTDLRNDLAALAPTANETKDAA
jgi:hypothetical protein